MFKKIKEIIAGNISSNEPPPKKPFQQPDDASNLVAQRRLMRRVKAVVSVSLALSAGAFLSCQRMLGFEEEQETKKQEVKKQEPASLQTVPTSTPEAKSEPSSAGSGLVIPPTSQLTTTTQPTQPTSHPKKSSTDKHRKGMPVLDNLLE